MDAALAQLQQVARTAEGTSRQRLMSTLHELAYSMETPDETLHRYGSMNLQTAVIKTGFDLKLFRCLLRYNDTGATVEELALETGAEAVLLGRLLRYLAGIGAINQLSADQFAPNHLTKNLAEDVTEAGVNHYFGTVSPQYQALPSFLKRTEYKNPTDEMHTVFQDAHNTTLHAFSWFSEHPENLTYFNNFMAFRREPELSWLTVYPITEEAKDCNDANRPVYVNIGGGIGHQCAQFKKAYPDIPGRVILQDMPHSIANALQTPGVENMAHDFFEPQPIRGAKFYFMRGVLHNHPPQKVLQLLENTKAAMAKDSVLLLDEMILPEKGANVDALSMDLTMLSAFAGMERTETQWREVIDEAGLKLERVFVYNEVSHESVMEVRLP